ncbi:hypothetical protein GCM10009802_41070 [Streptomyces synnematoformans]|uniref:Uncharacterized protein n=1 Tax=Streptomyces synnematoformans TaxID=415721 RepID=A0ABN2YUH0_9ACTN
MGCGPVSEYVSEDEALQRFVAHSNLCFAVGGADSLATLELLLTTKVINIGPRKGGSRKGAARAAGPPAGAGQRHRPRGPAVRRYGGRARTAARSARSPLVTVCWTADRSNPSCTGPGRWRRRPS